MKKRFGALGDIEDPEEKHDMILETYRDAGKKVIAGGPKRRASHG